MKTLLAHLGDQATVPAMDSRRLWQLGRRKRRLDRVRAAAAALAVLMLAGIPFLGTAPLMPAEGATELPAVFEAPYLWQASLAGSPNGAAMAVLTDTPRLFGRELSEDIGVVAVVRHDGSYRSRWFLSWSNPVSADGRFLATGNEIVDLGSGRTQRYGDSGLIPLAWSRDGRHLAATDRVPAEAESPIVSIYDTVTGSTRELKQSNGAVVRAAFSPDGAKLALQSTGMLKVVNLSDGSVVIGRGISPGTELAGPAAWTPDSAALALIGRTACHRHPYGAGIDGDRVDFRPDCERNTAGDTARWRLHLFEVGTGRYTGYPGNGREHPGYAVGVAGWLGTDPVVTVYQHGQPYPSSLVRLRPDDSLETLTKAGTRGLQVPQNLLERRPFGGDNAAPSIFAAQPAAYGILAVILLTVALPLAWILRRIVRHRRRRRLPHNDGGRTG